MQDLTNCKINQRDNELVAQLTLSILKKAAQYEQRIENIKTLMKFTPSKQSDKKKKIN